MNTGVANKVEESQNSQAETAQFLTFNLAGESYAIGILHIREILEFGEVDITKVPMMPAYIRGVINLRGSVVPVLDLGVRLGGELIKIAKRSSIIITEIEHDGESLEIGVVVSEVNEVLEIPDSEIEAAPAFGANIRADFIQGMGKVGGKFVVLLDVGKVLSIDELAMLDDMSHHAGTVTASTANFDKSIQPNPTEIH